MTAKQSAAARKMSPARRRAFLKMISRTPNKSRRRARARRSNEAPSVRVVPLQTVANPKRRRKGARRRVGSSFTQRAIALVIPHRKAQTMKAKRKSTKRRRNPGALLVNPARKVKRSRKRRRNPGALKAGIGMLLTSAIPAVAGGFALGFLDAKFLANKSFAVRSVGKGLIAVGVGLAARRFLSPVAAGVAMGAVLGSFGSEVGMRIGGGVVAPSASEAGKQVATAGKMAELIQGAAEEDSRIAELLVGPSKAQSYIEPGIGQSYAQAIAKNDPYDMGVGDDMGDEMGDDD